MVQYFLIGLTAKQLETLGLSPVTANATDVETAVRNLLDSKAAVTLKAKCKEDITDSDNVLFCEGETYDFTFKDGVYIGNGEEGKVDIDQAVFNKFFETIDT